MRGGENEHEPVREIMFGHSWPGGGGARHANGDGSVRHGDGDAWRDGGDDGARHGEDGDVWHGGGLCVSDVKEGADSLLQYRGVAAAEQ